MSVNTDSLMYLYFFQQIMDQFFYVYGIKYQQQDPKSIREGSETKQVDLGELYLTGGPQSQTLKTLQLTQLQSFQRFGPPSSLGTLTLHLFSRSRTCWELQLVHTVRQKSGHFGLQSLQNWSLCRILKLL